MPNENLVVITELNNTVVASSPGPQGQRGKTILNGSGAPSNNLGLTGDFYYDTLTSYFYGPKLSDASWVGATNYALQQLPTEFSFEYTWEINQLVGPFQNEYSLTVDHDLGFKPNVTVQNSAGDIVETGILYTNNNEVILKMAQPFSGTVYLS